MVFLYFNEKLFVKKLKFSLNLNLPINLDIILTIITLPFLQKIYIDWDFDKDSKYGKVNLALIKH